MSKERDILKSLLLKEELELLDKLKEKVLSQEQFTQEVADVIAPALKRAGEKDQQLTRALAVPIKKGVIQAFSTSKQSIIDALLPIMGKLIRKTVANSIKQFVADINRALEQKGLSFKSLKWRMQAIKAGISYPEILFQKTIRYQVEELFLISRKNGLLIEHAGTDEHLKDNNAISAMLTVIQDFIRDSFNQGEAHLQSVNIEDKEYIITSGPNAYLASVVKGNPTERLKEKSQQLIENIHAEFSTTLSTEETYRNVPELKEYLASHLITKNKESEQKPPNKAPWILAGILLLSGLAYLAYQHYQKNQLYKNLITKAENIEGFYLHSVNKTSKGFEIKGLIDPLADVSPLKSDNVVLITKPYLSLDNSIILKRLDSLLLDYPNIKAEIKTDKIILSGMVNQHDESNVLLKVMNSAGSLPIENHLVTDYSQDIENLLSHYNDKINQLTYHYDQQNLSLVGNTTYHTQQQLKSLIHKISETIIIDDRQLNIVDSNEKLIAEINNTSINIPQLEAGLEKNKLIRIYKSLQSLLQRQSKISLEVIGESDCNGKKSDFYSAKRASKIKQLLIQNTIPASTIITTVKACESFDNPMDNAQQNVSFTIKK